MNIFEFIEDRFSIFIDTICCFNCFEPEEIEYDSDYITNYIDKLTREIDYNEKYSIH